MLEDRIYQDYVKALKNKDKDRTQFLSYLRAGLKYAAISFKKDKLDDEQVMSVLKKEQKRLEETRESALTAGKQEMAEQAKREIAVIGEYLPEMMDESQMQLLVEQVVSDLNASSIKDMGRVMKELTARAGMRADAKKMNELAKSKLSAGA